MSTIGIVMAAMPALIYWAAGSPTARRPVVSIGTLVAFVSLQQGLFRPAVSLLRTGVQMQTSLALFRRIFEYLDLPIDITEPGDPVAPDQVRGEVRFEDVDFPYDDTSGADPRRHRHHRPRRQQPGRRRRRPAPARPRSATWCPGCTT